MTQGALPQAYCWMMQQCCIAMDPARSRCCAGTTHSGRDCICTTHPLPHFTYFAVHVILAWCLPPQEYCTNNPDEISRIAACQRKVDDVRSVMVENIEKVRPDSRCAAGMCGGVHGAPTCSSRKHAWEPGLVGCRVKMSDI